MLRKQWAELTPEQQEEILKQKQQNWQNKNEEERQEKILRATRNLLTRATFREILALRTTLTRRKPTRPGDFSITDVSNGRLIRYDY